MLEREIAWQMLFRDCQSTRFSLPISIWNNIAIFANQQDIAVNNYRTAFPNFRLEDIPIGNSQTIVLCDVFTGNTRLIAPPFWRRRLLEVIHGLSTSRFSLCKSYLLQSFVGYRINKEVQLWTKQCLECQKTKAQRHVKAPISPYSAPCTRFQHSNIDIVRPLPPSKGSRLIPLDNGGSIFPLARGGFHERCNY